MDGRAEEVFSADASELQGKGGQTWTAYFDFEDETSALSEGDIIYCAFRDTGYFVNNWGTDSFSLTLAPYIDEAIVEGQGSDGYYPIIPNLPDIKQVDFIKTIAAISGTFVVVVNDTTLGFFLWMILYRIEIRHTIGRVKWLLLSKKINHKKLVTRLKILRKRIYLHGKKIIQ